MTNTRLNKQIVNRFFGHFTEGNVPAALALMAEDSTWRIPGKPGSTPIAGTRSKEQMSRVFHGMFERLKNGVTMTVKTLTGEEDRVAVEVESHGELKNDRLYHNEYHLLFTLQDGKIREVHEYYDTEHASKVWFTP
jgi:ketosteroid isomerase-like protein